MTGTLKPGDLPNARTQDRDTRRALGSSEGVTSGDRAGRECSCADGLALARWSVLLPLGIAPPWMRTALARLESSFPGFSFAVSRGWRGLRFEAWRSSAADGLYAVKTDDPRELWRELETAQR